jgi:hypothetical protein
MPDQIDYILKHELSGYPPFDCAGREAIPAGARIAVTEWDHTEVESLIQWGGHSLRVVKNDLINFAEPV